jgi:protein-tyrosine phosphatase
MGFVDLHCHLLPGVDDGPVTLDESVAYARAAAAAGTTTIVATSHVELLDVRELPERVEEVRAALEEEGIDLRLLVGGELKHFSIPYLDEDDLEILAQGPPGARWLLYEVPFEGVTTDFLAGAQELRDRGYGLLLAHPERSADILDGGLEALGPELRAGSVVAANVGPITRRESAARHAASLELLRRGIVGLIATDAHAPTRPYTLAEAYAAIRELTGDDALARRLTGTTATAVLRDGLSVSAARTGSAAR